MHKYFNNGWFWLLLLCSFFIAFAVFPIGNKLLLFILSGICSGIFYGVNNHVIFHHQYDKKYYKDNKPIFMALGIFPGVPELNPIAQLHIFWVHIISGIMGSASLYLLSTRLSSIESIIESDKLILNLILLLISVLGYVGYIPRTLWFFASKGGLGIDKPS